MSEGQNMSVSIIGLAEIADRHEMRNLPQKENPKKIDPKSINGVGHQSPTHQGRQGPGRQTLSPDPPIGDGARRGVNVQMPFVR